MLSKKSALFLLSFNLDNKNSIASIVPMGLRMRLNTYVFWRSIGPINNSSFLVLDFVEADAKKIMMSVNHGTRISEQHIIVIMYNLLCAIKFIHSANLMHRDLKPANILIDSQS